AVALTGRVDLHHHLEADPLAPRQRHGRRRLEDVAPAALGAALARHVSRRAAVADALRIAAAAVAAGVAAHLREVRVEEEVTIAVEVDGGAGVAVPVRAAASVAAALPVGVRA